MKTKYKVFLFIGLIIATINCEEKDLSLNPTDIITDSRINNKENNEITPEIQQYPHFNEPNEEIQQINTTMNETTTNSTQKVFICKPGVGGDPVKIINGTQLLTLLMPEPNITSKEMPADCILVLFYAKYCTFSSMAAPHFNALSRAFPDIKLAAIDAMRNHIFNTQNGIVGVPTLILFHNGRPIGKFNDTEYTLELFSRFLIKNTGLKPRDKSYVTSADFAGPVPSTPERDTDYFLGLSWTFIFVCLIYYFTKSRWWKWIVEMVQNTWREAEAQHEHND